MSSEVLARLKPFGISFEKSLTDLIKGIRSHSKTSPESLLAFLNDAIQECKNELTSTDIEVKATAALKLAYLEMYGFDMSWSNFNILEVMSSSKFQQKRIGYLAATQSFKNEQELLILATNQFKKDLHSHNHVEVGLALSGIATVVTPSLAKDIVDDVLMKLSHSKPYIRKKAVLALFKVFVQYPESLKAALPRVMEKLDDPDVSVVSATITVVCEISKKNPHLFLNYLPRFFTILEESTNNWLIIRILKLFQSLLKVEQRMKKRTMPSILSLMVKSEATSIKYESINCIMDGKMLSESSSKDREVAKECVDQILTYFDQRLDPNLLYMGLLAMIKITDIYPQFIHKMREVSNFLTFCLGHREIVIKRKALEVCHYLVTEDNLAELVKKLLLQLLPENCSTEDPDGYKLEITSKILQISSSENYAHIPNFKWYVIALKELLNLTLLTDTSLENSGTTQLKQLTRDQIAEMLGAEFELLALKVPSVRPFLVSTVVRDYVKNLQLVNDSPKLMSRLFWIMGEYLDDFGHSGKNDDDDDEMDQITALSQKVTIFNSLVNVYVDQKLESFLFPVSKAITELESSETLCVLIEAVIKLFGSITSDYLQIYGKEGKLTPEKYAEVAYFLKKLISLLETWEDHDQYEVQERSLVWLEYLKLCLDAMNLSEKRVLALEEEELVYYKSSNSQETDSDESVGEKEHNDNSKNGSDSEMENGSDSEIENDSDSESEDEEKSGISKALDGAAEMKKESDIEEETNAEDGKELQLNQSSEENKDSEVGEERERELPQLLSKLLRSFFTSYQLKPVSATVQGRIPLPESLDLETVINTPPAYCLQESAPPSDDESSEEEVEPAKVYEREASATDRLARLKDDPYYITGLTKKKVKSKPTITGLKEISTPEPSSETASVSDKPKKAKKMKKEKVVVLLEETLGHEEVASPKPVKAKKSKNKFMITSPDFDSGLESVSLEANDQEYKVDLEQLRTKLAQQTLKKEKRKKSRKTESKERAEPKEKSESKGRVEPKEKAPVKAEPESAVVPAEKPKKKKKKKAIIEE